MTEQTSTPTTLQQAIIYFADADNCLNYLASRRWPDGVVCPTCGRTDVKFLANQRKWQCKSVHQRRQFSVKIGTIFEDSPLGLDKWLMAVWMITNCKNGVSSYEIHRAIKDALDPNGILAPGKQGIWPASMRTDAGDGGTG